MMTITMVQEMISVQFEHATSEEPQVPTAPFL